MAAPFTLAPLPWADDALAPVISAKTISFHYYKHHKTYVDTLNKLVAESRFAEMSLEEIARATSNATAENEKKIFNNAGQAWNHDFFWHSLTPKGTKPGGALKAAIDRDFGGLDSLLEKLATAGKDQFGSGWVWLTSTGGKLAVEKTSNAMTPMAHGVNCLLTVDVWEHAYYLDYQNERPKYLEAVLAKVLNWDFAGENLARESTPAMVRQASQFEKAKQDVSKCFDNPQAIVDADNFTPIQKIELLKQWEMDLRQLMVASDENMPGTSPGQTAELMTNVRSLLAGLGADEAKAATVNKAGG